tara:strand:+ start:22570 stop:23217 length:648 start_codon:yes stop_codon:yes gene_type:complete
MFKNPDHDCPLCPRLKSFRDANAAAYPDWHNGPVDAFGPLSAKVLVVGLAPGLRGANRTSRPFTGDWAGDLLYATLLKFGFASGTYGKTSDDGLELIDCRVTNAVRCVPPENKPTGPETRTCNPFLKNEIDAMPDLRAILALGTLSHGAVLTALGVRKSLVKFGHRARHALPGDDFLPTLFNSYHCSRYNTNTGRLTEAMFEDVFSDIRHFIAAP